MDRLKNPFAPTEDVDMNNDTVGTPGDDFLAFSSTSTPAKGYTDNTNFKPKRGKSNRMGNWERFGEANQQYSPYRSQWGQEGDGRYKHRGTFNFPGSPNPNGFSAVATPHQRFQHGGRQPFHRSTPRSEPGPRGGANYRGAPGFFGTPTQGNFNHFQNIRSRHNFRGSHSQRGNEWRGNNRERYSRSSDSGTGYFHPSMLEDPWADLRRNKQSISTFSSSTSSSKIASSSSEILHESMSDSMIPQVGDTIFERNEDLRRNTTLEEKTLEGQESLDNSRYSDNSSDEDNVIITIGETLHKQSGKESGRNISAPSTPGTVISREQEDQRMESAVSKSDSMIPLVGDSILAQDITIDPDS